MGVLGMQLNILITIITQHFIGPFSCIVTAGQLTGQLNLFTVSLLKGTSLNE